MFKKKYLAFFYALCLTSNTITLYSTGSQLQIIGTLTDSDVFTYPNAQQVDLAGNLKVDYAAHSNTPTCLSWGPRFITSGDSFGAIKLWDPQRKELIESFIWQSYIPIALSWSPDGTTLAMLSTSKEQELILRTIDFRNQYKPKRITKANIPYTVIPDLIWLNEHSIQIGSPTENLSLVTIFSTKNNAFSEQHENTCLMSPDKSYRTKIIDGTLCIVDKNRSSIAHIDNFTHYSWVPGQHQTFASIQSFGHERVSDTIVQSIIFTDFLRNGIAPREFSLGSIIVSSFCFSPDGNSMIIGDTTGKLIIVDTSSLGTIDEKRRSLGRTNTTQF